MQQQKPYYETLKECPLFTDLDEANTNDLLSLFQEKKWARNTCILSYENLSYHTYIILSGRIKMYQAEEETGKEITMFLLTTCDVFDLFCLLDGIRHDVYYECLDEVRVLAGSTDRLRKWLIHHPDRYLHLLPYAGKQMRLLENYVSDLSFADISTRLLKLLIRNTNGNSRLDLINDLSNREIAHLIGSTGAVINRHLQKLKKNGSIKTSRNRLEIRDLNSLLHLLEEEGKKRRS